MVDPSLVNTVEGTFDVGTTVVLSAVLGTTVVESSVVKLVSATKNKEIFF